MRNHHCDDGQDASRLDDRGRRSPWGRPDASLMLAQHSLARRGSRKPERSSANPPRGLRISTGPCDPAGTSRPRGLRRPPNRADRVVANDRVRGGLRLGRRRRARPRRPGARSPFGGRRRRARPRWSTPAGSAAAAIATWVVRPTRATGNRVRARHRRRSAPTTRPCRRCRRHPVPRPPTWSTTAPA